MRGPFRFAGKSYDSASDFLNALITNAPTDGGPSTIYLPAPVTFAPQTGDNRFIKVGFLFLDRPNVAQPLSYLEIETPAVYPNTDAQGNPLATSTRPDGIFPPFMLLDLGQSPDALPGFGGGIAYQNRAPRFTGGWTPIAQDGTTTILVYYCSPRPGPGVTDLNGPVPAFPPTANDPEMRGPSVLRFRPSNLQSLTILRPTPDYSLPSPLFPNPFLPTRLSLAPPVDIDTSEQSFNFFGITVPSFLLWRDEPPLRYLGLDTETIALQLFQRSLVN